MTESIAASSIFVQAACKRLSRHDVDPNVTNGHEFQGVKQFRQMFGSDDRAIKCRFVHLADETEPIWDDGALTWYEVGRKNRPPEYRAYYRTALVWNLAEPGDLLYLIESRGSGLLAVIAREQSDFNVKVSSLLGLDPDLVTYRDYRVDSADLDVEMLDAFLESVGRSEALLLSTTDFEAIALEVMSERQILPQELLKMPTRTVSAVARDIASRTADHSDDPDELIVLWSSTELQLFTYLEHQRLQPIVEAGFSDVEQFIDAAMTTFQSRKARAGHSLQHHFEEILLRREIAFDPQCITEGRRRPDFVFPSREKYLDPTFPAEHLTMVAVKRTCRDRWRQVLTEASRIPIKHLLTLEHPISVHQTNEMQDSGVQLVVPKSYKREFTGDQQSGLMNISELLDLLENRELGSDGLKS